MGKQVLITGGAGFLGSHLADRLLREGHRVRMIDNLTPQVHPDGIPAYLNEEVELIVGDLRDPQAIRNALSDVEVIYHFAAAVGVGQSMYEIAHYMSVNTQGTAVLLQAILDTRTSVEKLVVASSMSIYGEGRYLCPRCMVSMTPGTRSGTQLRSGDWDVHCTICNSALLPEPTSEDKPSVVNSVYALSKRDQEELCLVYGRTYGLPVTALRFFNIYGTRQALSNPYTGVAAIFAAKLLNNQAPLVFEDGEQMRDFVSVHDVVQANLLAMQPGRSDGAVINVGGGMPIKISRIAEILAEALDVQIKPVITNKFRAGDIRHCYADISLARDLLGYEPLVTHEEGFTELAQWLQSQQATDQTDVMFRELTAYGLTA